MTDKLVREAAAGSAEEALRRSEEQYRSVVDNIKQVIFQTDARGRWKFLNAAWTEITGFTVAETLGRGFLGFVHPDDRLRHAEAFQPLLESRGEYFGHTARYLTKAGGFRWIEAFAQVTVDGGGAVLGIFGTLTDITERKRADEELAATRARLQHLLVSSPAVLYSAPAAATHVVTSISDNVRRQLGYAPDEILDDPEFWTSRLHPEDAPRTLAAWEAMLADGRQSEQYRLRDHEGAYRWIHDERRLVLNEAGHPVEIVGSWVDITDRRRAEDERVRLQAELQQAQKMEIAGRLAGGVAHDFNNLLTVITGRAQLLLAEAGALTDRQRRDVDLIRETGNRAAALTRQLLAFSRKQAVAPRVLDLNAVVANMNRMLRRLISEDVELVTAAEPRLGAVKADPGQMEQVILNLVVNARDAMPDGGRLTIALANARIDGDAARQRPSLPAGDYVVLSVTDTGCGMDAETQAHIFEPFFTTKSADKGTGLGLSTVYGIVKQSKGEVFIESAPGHGATFKIFLPRIEEAPEASVAPTGAPPPGGSETVLVAEDEAGVRELACEVLTRCGYKVLEGRHGREALEVARAHAGPIHLLLADVVMPSMSGGELAQQLTAERPAIRVLYMSGYTNDALAFQRVAEGEVALLEKPFTTDALALKVRAVLDRARPVANAAPPGGLGGCASHAPNSK